MAECSKGWGARCAAGKRPRCRCRCGGVNHGAQRRDPRKDQTEMHLTNNKIFEGPQRRTFLPSAGAQVGPIVGRRESAGALVNIEQHLVVHSPTGFEWSYGGSGPADLALNVLALFVEPPMAWRMHQDFKRDVIARQPQAGFVLEPFRVRDWIEGWWATNPPREWETEDAAGA